jgi:hypothetical protein
MQQRASVEGDSGSDSRVSLDASSAVVRIDSIALIVLSLCSSIVRVSPEYPYCQVLVSLKIAETSKAQRLVISSGA